MKALSLILIVVLIVLSGCQAAKRLGDTVRHLGGEHSPEIVKKIVEVAVEVAEVIEQSVEAAMVQKMWWAIPACLFGIGGSVFLIALKQVKIGVALAAGLLVTLLLSITVLKHFALIGWIVLGIGALIASYALYQAWLYRDGFSRLFLTGEAGKREMDDVAKTNTYGGEDDHGIAGVLQNKATERLVLAERKKAGLVRD